MRLPIWAYSVALVLALSAVGGVVMAIRADAVADERAKAAAATIKTLNEQLAAGRELTLKLDEQAAIDADEIRKLEERLAEIPEDDRPCLDSGQLDRLRRIDWPAWVGRHPGLSI